MTAPFEPRSHGAAVCACCGEELELVCPKDRTHEGMVIARDPMHAVRLAPPRRHEERHPRSLVCCEPGCGEPTAPYAGRGRPPVRCAHHLTLTRGYRVKWETKRRSA